MTNKRLFTALLAIVLIVGNIFAANPKREMRSTWLTLVSNIDWPRTKGTSEAAQAAQKKELIAYLDKLEELNMTSTCLHVRTMGDAAYPSQYAPWSSYVSGTRGVNPGWDPLAFFVEECHKRGIEAYVWLNPYRWSSTGLNAWSTEQDLEWKNKNMLIVGDNGTYVTFNPALKETRELIVNVIKEIVTNYAIDGMLFDDYFYPSGGTTESSSAPDYEQYKASGTTMSIGDWRRRNVNDMVADCYNAIKELRPDVRFGIGPAGVSHKSASKYGLPSVSSYGSSASDWQYAQIYCDPLTWMAEGTVDFISPQLYWETTHSTNGYEELTHWWSDAADKLKCHYYASQASYKTTNSGWGASEIVKQVKHNRTYAKNNNCGSIYYNTNTFKSYLSALGDDVYSTPALSPQITWKSGKTYGKVSNLVYSNGTLSWDATKNGNSIIRYTVYAVPTSVTIDKAMAADGDGIDVKYLQKVVYGTSYTISTDKQTNYYYVVCVFDGYGKEHEKTVVNYPDGDSEKAILVSPVNGSTVTWDAEFSWNNISNASFTIEIANDATFSNVVIQEKNITKNSAIVDLGVLESEKVYHWRVRASQSGKLESISESSTFTTPSRVTGPSQQLVSPENGAEIEEECNFLWWPVDGDMDYYTLEVSASKDFSTIKYSKDIEYEPLAESVSHTINASVLGKGTFYWRVISKGTHINPGYSEVRSFTITKFSVGEFEPGYAVKKDKNSYEKVGSLNVESIWMRSILSDYNNISFESSGSFNRTMCVVGDNVYVSGRSENSQGAKAYLRKYNIHTGEHMGDLMLGDEASVSYYPCNDVIKDSKGNVCITNLTLNVSSTPLKLFMVNLETGELELKANIVTSKGKRIDHTAVYGDVKSGNFYFFAAVSSTNTILRWKYVDGNKQSEEICTLSGVSNLGIAPRIVPVTENNIFIDGGATSLAMYSFSTGKTLESLQNSLTPSGKEANGCTYFTLAGKTYVVYAFNDDEAGTKNPAYTYNVVSIDDNMSFSSMQHLWTLPKDGLGNVNSATMQAPVDYAIIDNNTARVVMYVPGCGLCAYDITDTSLSGVENVFDSAVDIKVKANNIIINEVAQVVTVYNMMGMKVACATNVAELNVNLTSGLYIVEAIVNGKVYTKKAIIATR